MPKVRADPDQTKFDPDNLHRHQDFAPVKREQCSPGPEHSSNRHGPKLRHLDSHEDEFGSDDFEEVDFAVPEGDDPDGVTLGDSGELQLPHQPEGKPSRQSMPQHQLPNKNEPPRGQTSHQALSTTIPQPPGLKHPSNSLSSGGANITIQRSAATSMPTGPHGGQIGRTQVAQSRDSPPVNRPGDWSNTHEPPVGFYTARAAESLQKAQETPSAALQAPVFNPHLESPSIRKTAGIDHTKTKPVNRDIVGASSAVPSPMIRTSSSGLTNPQADRMRKVGMPGMASPLQNRGSYKPPQIKRPVDSGAGGGGGGGGGRSALGDVTTSSVNMAAEGGGDLKRPRIGMENREGSSILNA